MSSDMKLDEIVKAARFLQIEGAKDFDMNSLSASSSSKSGMKMSSGEGTEEEVSITAYCGDEGPDESMVRPFAWLAAQGRHHKNRPDDSSMPTSPSSFHSSDSFDSANGGLLPNGSPTVIVNGATGEFTTLYQQMSPINLKLNASTAENKQELKRKLLQKKRQLMLISNGIGSSSTAECTAQHLRKRACLEAERAANNGAHQTSQSPKLPITNDLQVTLGGQPVVEPLSLLMNGSKRGGGVRGGNGHEGKQQMKSADYFDDLENDNEHNLKIDEESVAAVASKDDFIKENVEDSLRGDSNNNNHHHYHQQEKSNQQRQHEVKDNVVIVNQNSSKCLMLKIKSGKIYKDDQLPETVHSGM